MSARGGEGGFPDPRTEDERARDREAVSRQTELLGRCGKGGLRPSLNDAVLPGARVAATSCSSRSCRCPAGPARCRW
jgi:hypothetical protein